jgi:hypothetical protein
MSPRPASILALLAFGATAPALLGAAAAPATPTLLWPVACKVGAGCEIQHYVDRDASPAVKDYACGNRSYDGHDGTDIRIPDMAAQRRGVAVLAAADGQVLRVRDGVADVSVRAAGPESVKDRECGNGLVIAHAGGFETQYCHLAQGSLKVKPGETVKAGAPLGNVGMSGLAEFPHLHLTVRQSGQVVDPFAYGAAAGTCNAGRSLWVQTPAYQARVVLNTGFAPGPVTLDAVEAGTAAAPPGADLPFLVAYVRAIGLKAGDVQELVVRGPDGAVVIENRAAPLARDQAQRLLFTGKRRPPQGWAKGRYAVRYTVSAGGKAVLTRDFALQI